jgi:hypothetical protein
MPSPDITRAQVLLRLDPALLEAVDVARVDKPRTAFLTDLIAGALAPEPDISPGQAPAADITPLGSQVGVDPQQAPGEPDEVFQRRRDGAPAKEGVRRMRPAPSPSAFMTREEAFAVMSATRERKLREKAKAK